MISVLSILITAIEISECRLVCAKSIQCVYAAYTFVYLMPSALYQDLSRYMRSDLLDM